MANRRDKFNQPDGDVRVVSRAPGPLTIGQLAEIRERIAAGEDRDDVLNEFAEARARELGLGSDD